MRCQFSPLIRTSVVSRCARIVGYKEPAIVIAFAHDSLFAHASVAFADRAAEPPHTNIARRLRDYSPKSAPIEFDRAAFVARAFTPAHGGQAAAFVPPGTRLLSYRLGDSDEFEVYSGLLDDAAMRAYVERASLLSAVLHRARQLRQARGQLARAAALSAQVTRCGLVCWPAHALSLADAAHGARALAHQSGARAAAVSAARSWRLSAARRLPCR
jgi:hypothetical protein